MKRWALCMVIMIAAAVAGCEHDHFVVEVTPEGDGFQRKLTCWHVSGEGGKDVRPLAKEKLAVIGKLYETSEAIEGGKKHVFTGRFTDKTPADVGGAGSYTHFASPLGSTSCYIERFRGNDDLEAELATRRAAADKLADLAIGWFESELGQEPGFDRLKTFLDNDLRRDLKNLAVYGWTAEAVQGYKSETEAEFLVRVAHYLCDRGYLSPQDLPRLVRAAWWGDDPAPLLEHVRRFVAAKMGVRAEEPAPASLAFLGDLKRFTASWERYLRTTELFKKRVEKWEQERKTDPLASAPTPDDVLLDLACQLALRFRMFEEDDVVELKLHCGQEPYETNGRWDQQAAAICWSNTLRPGAPLPVFCFALWSRPDRGFQEAHFGKVLLEGEDLAEYVVWYCGLNSEEAREWDQLIAGCEPDGDLRPAIKRFRFSSEPWPNPNKLEKGPASLADTPRGLILDALKPQEKSRPQPEKK